MGSTVKPQPETITIEEYRRLAGKVPRKRAKHAPRLDIPRAPDDERVGLRPLLEKGWCLQSPDAVRYRLYRPTGADTGLCETLKQACDRAKAIDKESGL